MVKYTDSNGDEVQIGKVIGKGGEASVYSIVDNDSLVAKIYNSHHSISNQKLEKLQKMCDSYDDEIAGYYAWPLKIIYSRKKAVGFLMENINSDSKGSSKYIKFIKFYNFRDRKKLFPSAEYKYMVHSALNLARAIRTLHEKGIVIGDINESNVFVNNTDATIKLLDCDSYQFENFLCNVGKPEYTAPELPNDLRCVERTPNHDCFALAVMIFLILVGKHPYSGIGSPQDIRKAITQCLYCYGDGAKKKNVSSIYPFSEMYNLLNSDIKNLFEKAFNTDKRPTAKDWIMALEKYENELVQCPNNDSHWYNPEYRSCIWCELEKDGFYAFGSDKTKKIKRNYNNQTPYKTNTTIKQNTNIQNNTSNTYNANVKNLNIHQTQPPKKKNKAGIWIAVYIIGALILSQVFFNMNEQNTSKKTTTQSQNNNYETAQDNTTYEEENPQQQEEEVPQYQEEEQQIQEKSTTQQEHPTGNKSTNIADINWQPYMNTLFNAIYKRWYPNENNLNTKMMAIFTINKAGCISDVDILDPTTRASIKYSRGYNLLTSINGVSCQYPLPQAYNRNSIGVETYSPNFQYTIYADHIDISSYVNNNKSTTSSKSSKTSTDNSQPDSKNTNKQNSSVKTQAEKPKTELEKSADDFFE